MPTCQPGYFSGTCSCMCRSTVLAVQIFNNSRHACVHVMLLHIYATTAVKYCHASTVMQLHVDVSLHRQLLMSLLLLLLLLLESAGWHSCMAGPCCSFRDTSHYCSSWTSTQEQQQQCQQCNVQQQQQHQQQQQQHVRRWSGPGEHMQCRTRGCWCRE